MHDANERTFLDAEREREAQREQEAQREKRRLEESQRTDQELRSGAAAPVLADSARKDTRAGGADAIPTEREALRGRVLLVEDERATQRLYSLHLRRAGAEVDVADDGRIAVER